MGLLSLIARLTLNASGFETGLKRAESATSKFSRNLSGSVKGQLAAAFGTAAIVAATKNAVDYASKIKDVSEGLGISSDAAQEFDYALKQNGGSIEDAASALRKLAMARQAALNEPDGKIAEAFQHLGVSIDDLKQKRVEDIFRQIGQSIKDAQQPQQILQDSFELMGNSALPVIAAMRDGLDEASERAHNMGIIIDENVINSLDDMGDRVDTLKARLTSMLAEGLAGFVKLGQTIASALEWTVGGWATYWGSRSGGASDEEAGKMAKEFGESVFKKDFAAEAEVKRRSERRKKLASEMLSFDAEASAQKANENDPKFKLAQMSVNNLQQIGAFVGSNPMLVEQRQTNQLLRKIETSVRQHPKLFPGITTGSW